MALEQSAAPATTSDAGRAVSPALGVDGGPSPVEVAQLRENVLSAAVNIPERLSYRIKRALLGEPLSDGPTTRRETVQESRARCAVERLHLLVRIWDGGDARRLVPVFGLASFHILGPMTAVVIGVIDPHDALLSRGRHGLHEGRRLLRSGARQLRAESGANRRCRAHDRLHRDGGSPGRGGHLAITSLVPSIEHWNLEITIGLVLILAYGNLRGVRGGRQGVCLPDLFLLLLHDAGDCFSVSDARFSAIYRSTRRTLPGQFPVTNQHDAILSWAAIFVLLKRLRQRRVVTHRPGGNLQRGERVPATSRRQRAPNVVPDESHARLSRRRSLISGRHRRTLCPTRTAAPTVISQVAKAAFGTSSIGHVGFVLVQLATALIL